MINNKDFDLFPVGTRVRIKCKMQDMYFFSTKETGIVIKNTGDYLGIIVGFDDEFIAIIVNDYLNTEWIRYAFNFNPDDLEILGKPTKKSLQQAKKRYKLHYADELKQVKEMKVCKACGK